MPDWKAFIVEAGVLPKEFTCSGNRWGGGGSSGKNGKIEMKRFRNVTFVRRKQLFMLLVQLSYNQDLWVCYCFFILSYYE